MVETDTLRARDFSVPVSSSELAPLGVLECAMDIVICPDRFLPAAVTALEGVIRILRGVAYKGG